MSGHSRWANIKHKKARSDAKRGKAWSKCSRAIMAAARAGGGNPDANVSLRFAIEEAKAVNMPRDTIEHAIRKATGEAAGQNFESMIYEGYGAGGVALMLEILTDNRNRTAPEIRKLFEKHGGNLGATGCVGYMFDSRGQVCVAKTDADEDSVINAALEAGAEDVKDEGEFWQVLSQPSAFITVRDALQKAGFTIESAQITMIPQTTVNCSGKDAERVLALVEALEDHDDVQKVHANFEIPDEEMASLQ
jgi:YebC/PmpR family DNA-binding regulatory protein